MEEGTLDEEGMQHVIELVRSKGGKVELDSVKPKQRSIVRVVAWKCNNCGAKRNVEADFGRPQDPPGACPRCGVDDVWEPEESIARCPQCKRIYALDTEDKEREISEHRCPVVSVYIPEEAPHVYELKGRYVGMMTSGRTSVLLIEPTDFDMGERKVIEVRRQVSPEEAKVFAEDHKFGDPVSLHVDLRQKSVTVKFERQGDLNEKAVGADRDYSAHN